MYMYPRKVGATVLRSTASLPLESYTQYPAQGSETKESRVSGVTPSSAATLSELGIILSSDMQLADIDPLALLLSHACLEVQRQFAEALLCIIISLLRIRSTPYPLRTPYCWLARGAAPFRTRHRATVSRAPSVAVLCCSYSVLILRTP